VLSDYATSERLPAYANLYTVVWPLVQAGTGAEYSDKRIAAMQRLFSGQAALEEVRQVLQQYQVDYILFNEIEAKPAGLTDKTFADHPELFQVAAETYVDQNLRLASLRQELQSGAPGAAQRWRVTLYRVVR
jgi:hypothetical protein